MYRRIDLDSCTGIGCKVNEETIGWWATQSKKHKMKHLAIMVIELQYKML